MSTWGFKNNLILDNNKYLTLFDPTNVTKSDIIGLDTNSNLNINSASGDIFLNSNNSGSETFINFNNSKNVLVSSKLAVGISSTSNINANLTLVKNGFIGINTTRNSNDSYLGLAGSSSLSNTTGSRILLYGNDNTNGNNGNLNLYAGNSSFGSINLFTGNDSNTFQILKTGTSNFSPNGSTIRVSISDTNTLFTHQVQFTNTNTSTSATTGSVLVNGGLGIVGDTFISGTLNINSASGNINFASSTDAVNYSTGALALFGGLAIRTSTLAVSAVNGGGLSVAGGFGLGGNAIFNSTLEVLSGITTSTILSTGLTTGNIQSTGLTTGHIQSTGLTTGNINFTGALYQNGVAYLGSQWSGTNGNLLYYGSTGTTYIGINTSTPTFNLDVSGGARITTGLTTGTILSTGITTGNIQSTGLTTGNINFTGALYQNGVAYLGSQWSGTNGNLLYYGSTGTTYVGINTSTPSFNLDVSGGARITTGLTTGSILSTGLTTENINFTGALYQNGVAYLGSQWSGTNGNLLYYGSTGTTYVGINTSTPSFNLDVSGGARITIGLTTGSILSTGITTGRILSTGITTGDINFTGALYQNNSPYISSQWTGTNGNNLFYGSTGSIFVGIGTTNPTFNLDVNGSARINTGLSTGNIYTNLLNVNNVSYTFAGSCTAGNNVVVDTNLLGLILPTATTRSFTIVISVSTIVSSGSNYFTQYTVEGIQTDSGWIIDDYFIGDIPNITFTITSTGQLQYKSNNVISWTSTILRYRANGIYV